jgi:hypothetical protein
VRADARIIAATNRDLEQAVAGGDGAMHLMVYAAYGRMGIYMMQAYCRPLGSAR